MHLFSFWCKRRETYKSSMNPWYHKLLFKRPKITIRSECARFLELFAKDLVQSALVETAALEDADGNSHLFATLGLVILGLQNVNQPRSGMTIPQRC